VRAGTPPGLDGAQKYMYNFAATSPRICRCGHTKANRLNGLAIEENFMSVQFASQLPLQLQTIYVTSWILTAHKKVTLIFLLELHYGFQIYRWMRLEFLELHPIQLLHCH
jgi:hypothetical protein